MISNRVLVSEFAKFLGEQKWDLFVTITFRTAHSYIKAERRFKQFFKGLNTKEKKFIDKYIFCFVVYEREHIRDSVHIHSLVRGIDPMYAKSIEERCRADFGRTEIYSYNSEKAARFYIAGKYVSRDLVHYDFYRINSRVR